MLPRYFSAMVRLCRVYMREQEKSGVDPTKINDNPLKTHLRQNGFNWEEIDAHYRAAKLRALEQLKRHGENGGVLPVRIRIYDASETETFVVDNFLSRSPGWLRSKIIYAVNNRKTVEISSIDD